MLVGHETSDILDFFQINVLSYFCILRFHKMTRGVIFIITVLIISITMITVVADKDRDVEDRV